VAANPYSARLEAAEADAQAARAAADAAQRTVAELAQRVDGLEALVARARSVPAIAKFLDAPPASGRKRSWDGI